MSLIRLDTEQLKFFLSYLDQDILCLAIAKAIATKLRLPVDKQDDPQEFYLQYLSDTVKRAVSFFNEIKVLNTTRVIQATKDFWLFRYSLVHSVSIKNNEYSTSEIKESDKSLFVHTFDYSTYLSNTYIEYQKLDFYKAQIYLYHISKALEQSKIFASSRDL